MEYKQELFQYLRKLLGAERLSLDPEVYRKKAQNAFDKWVAAPRGDQKPRKNELMFKDASEINNLVNAVIEKKNVPRNNIPHYNRLPDDYQWSTTQSATHETWGGAPYRQGKVVACLASLVTLVASLAPSHT